MCLLFAAFSNYALYSLLVCVFLKFVFRLSLLYCPRSTRLVFFAFVSIRTYLFTVACRASDISFVLFDISARSYARFTLLLGRQLNQSISVFVSFLYVARTYLCFFMLILVSCSLSYYTTLSVFCRFLYFLCAWISVE